MLDILTTEPQWQGIVFRVARINSVCASMRRHAVRQNGELKCRINISHLIYQSKLVSFLVMENVIDCSLTLQFRWPRYSAGKKHQLLFVQAASAFNRAQREEQYCFPFASPSAEHCLHVPSVAASMQRVWHCTRGKKTF